jgi:glycerol-3-phosphate dehydrogenase (NAD(P)+)
MFAIAAVRCFNTCMYKKITIIGDGAMGTVCGMLLCDKSLEVTMWGHDAEQLAEFEEKRENTRFLPGHKLPDSLVLEADIAKAVAGADLIVSAVPCQFMRGVWQGFVAHVAAGVAIVSVTKGLEKGTMLRPTEILAEIMGENHAYATLSGPTIADELVRKLPATACAACDNQEVAKNIQDAFNSKVFRVYTNNDTVGVEVAGALKNVIAIAAGIIDGIKAGDNAKAALLARGLAEIKRLGMAMGAMETTFAGLSGLGDLVTTCISPHGRNRSFGERIGQGMTAEQALAATNSVVEGAATCESVLKLSERYGVEMPITQAVFDVISGGKSVTDAIVDLMSRETKAE